MLLIFGRISAVFTHFNNLSTYYIPSVTTELIKNIDEKTDVRWENLLYYFIFRHKSHTKWTRIEPGPSRWEAGLSYGSEWVSETEVIPAEIDPCFLITTPLKQNILSITETSDTTLRLE